jgi:serine phosphatase RsbU (regulator of sigma subunit)
VPEYPRHDLSKGLTIAWLTPRPLRAPRRAAWFSLALAASIVVFVADDLSGSELSLSLFYLAPVAAASWFVGRWAGVSLSLISTIGWVGAYWLNGRFFSHPAILYWNVVVELGVFISLALSLSAVRRGIEIELGLVTELKETYARLDRELEQVGDIQRQLLPEEAPRIPGYRLAVHYATSTRAGGDYYDFFTLRDGRFGLLVADASGHGTPAAVVMAMTRALVHAAPEALESPERLLAVANRELRRSILHGQFVTACYVTLDPASGRLEYAMAGHNPPYIVRADSGEAEPFENPTGPPLGLFEAPDFCRRAARLGPGDLLALYTDGITEVAMSDGGLFGEERLRSLLARHRAANPETIRDRLLEELGVHSGTSAPADDRTLVLVQADA